VISACFGVGLLFGLLVGWGWLCSLMRLKANLIFKLEFLLLPFAPTEA